MPANYFNDGLNIIRTTTAIKNYFGEVTPILRFPPNIGDSVNPTQSTDLSAIPFVVFAPYKRSTILNTASASLYSLNPENVLDRIPAPEFNIVLPLPSSALSTAYRVTYDASELGTTGELVSGLKRLASVELNKEGAIKGLTVAAESFVRLATGALEGAASEIGFDTQVATRLAAGVIDNPFTEYMFRNVQFREHTFNFSFIPRNIKESRLLDSIAQYFKFFMLPAYKTINGTTAASYFEFPFEWQITHSTQDTTFRLLPSVLKDFEVDYGSGLDSPKFFYDGNQTRYPTKISMKMVFQEIILLTRDRIDTPRLEDNPGFDPNQTFNRNMNFTRYRF